MDSMNIRFKELRLKCEKSQEEWGKILGLTKSGISDIERGRRNVTEQHLIMLSNWTEQSVNIDWIRTGEGEMFRHLTDKEKLMKYTALLLKDTDSAVVSAIQALIVTYEQLDNASKAVLEKIAEQYIENLKKSR